MKDKNGNTIHPTGTDQNGNKFFSHYEKCTPSEPCADCASREIGRILGSGSTGEVVRNAEKQIDDFFSTNWGARGLARMSAAEHAEDAMIDPNPFD